MVSHILSLTLKRNSNMAHYKQLSLHLFNDDNSLATLIVYELYCLLELTLVFAIKKAKQLTSYVMMTVCVKSTLLNSFRLLANLSKNIFSPLNTLE